MKKNILSSLLLTLGLLVVLCVVYPLIIWGIAQFTPNQGKGFVFEQNGKTYYKNSGQLFTKDQYFWSRPSAVDYNAAGSGASNKGATNAEYIKEVEKRITDFMVANPTVKKEEIPVDLITASGSGLDPEFSVQAALVQANRVAKARGIEVHIVNELITKYTQNPLLGLFGPQKINVLELNLALDKVLSK